MHGGDGLSDDLKAFQISESPRSSAGGLRPSPEWCADQLVPPSNPTESTGQERKGAHGAVLGSRGQGRGEVGKGTGPAILVACPAFIFVIV